MTKLWKKSELGFALLWIAVYVIGNSVSAQLSDELGHKYCVTVAFNLAMSLFLFLWIRKNGLMERYGLCKATLPSRRFLWYIPLIILASANLWRGVAVTLSVRETLFGICNMLGVGFLEELLFRGFLFRAVSQRGVRRGVVISSLSFGLGHVVNLFNGRGMTLADNLWQIGSAIAFGFLFVMLFYRGGSLWPCVLTHAAFNIADIFSGATDATAPVQIFWNAAVLVLMVGYTWFVAKIPPDDAKHGETDGTEKG